MKIILLLIVLSFTKNAFSVEFIAHRGFPGYTPFSIKLDPGKKHDLRSGDIMENTMAAFIRAQKYGFNKIEFDVVLTKDKKIVVAHDQNLTRVTRHSSRKKIINLTYQELQNYNLLDGQKIILAEEVFRRFKKTIKYDIEIKTTMGENAKTILMNLIKLIEKYKLEDYVTLSCFRPKILKYVKKINPRIKTGFLVTNDKFYKSWSLIFLARNYVDSVSFEHTMLNKKRVKKYQKKGYKVIAWTVDNEQRLSDLIDMGVDGIMTNMIAPKYAPRD